MSARPWLIFDLCLVGPNGSLHPSPAATSRDDGGADQERQGLPEGDRGGRRRPPREYPPDGNRRDVGSSHLATLTWPSRGDCPTQTPEMPKPTGEGGP
jgi:hypothetical protein